MKCLFSNIEIKSVATCLPKGILEMCSLVDVFGEKEVKATVQGSGIQRVHVAEEKETTADICLKAAELIFEKEQIDPTSIDGLIFVSQTFEYLNPITAAIMQGKLGLTKECVCFDISFGCSGYINGLFQAASLIASGACNKVLILAGDTNSKIIDKKEKASVMVFGDAGSATIVAKGESSLGFHICTDGYNYQTVLNPRGGYRCWPENKAIDYQPETSIMSGDDVFSFIISVAPKSISTILEYMKWEKDDVDFYGLHQATKVTVDFMRKKLKLAHPERAPFDIQDYGNTGPTTVPLVLTDWPYRANNIDTSTWKKVILSAYGVGLSWGSIACDLSKTNIYKPINQ
jgi:3-oxoacyl-[acyl-carrier-protein] synthase III